MPLLVTSAAGANGDGFGLLLAFDRDGTPLGSFSNDDRIADPRGLGVDQQQELLFLNSGADRRLALDRNGKVVRDTGLIEGLNPGGGNFGPDARYYVGSRSARTIVAFPAELGAVGEHILPPGIVPFPRGFAFGRQTVPCLRHRSRWPRGRHHRRLRPKRSDRAELGGEGSGTQPARPRNRA
jgi:hypothetical protein